MDEPAIYETIGQSLAKGMSNQEIVTTLVSMGNISEEEAVKHLRSVYDHWNNIHELLQPKKTDLLNWHLQLRHKLLQNAMEDGNDMKAVRVALAILESMAELQDIKAIEGGTRESITINLVPKQVKEEPNGS